jgi:hypothetical protein
MNHRAWRRALAWAVCATGLGSLPAFAVTLGQIDTFATGATAGWRVGPAHPLPPSIVATGGPAGAGDRYLLQQAIGGSGPASHLAIENRAQWAGNYTAAGITALTMDVANFGDTDLSLRLLFDTFDGARAWSTVPLAVPAGSGWQSLYFPIGPNDLNIQGGAGIGAGLSQVVAIRIFHSTSPGFPGEAIVARIGIDNISAVPEPPAALLLALGLGALAWRRRSSLPELGAAARLKAPS